MLHEIQMAEEQIRKAEDEILDAMEEMEGTEKELKAAETDLKRRLDEIQELIRKDEASVPQLEAEVGDLLVRKSDVEKLIPGELLDRYRRIADKRKGVALAEAKDELCTLCHVRIRPQVYADLRQGEVINACDSCSRILFVREAV
jgi:predicted  nucleic acid-binding Zn-ribbon protein